MPRAVIPILKFVGTVSLGLLTGISYSHALLTTPALTLLPSATTAQETSQSLTASSRNHSTALLLVSISSYTLAFLLSPPRGGRHPYLLWTSLVATAGWGTSYYLTSQHAARSRTEVIYSGKSSHSIHGEDDDYIDATHSTANLTPTSGSAGSDNGYGLHDDATKLNGEEVRRSMEVFGTVEGIRAGITGLAFFMGVVGIWGDGFGVARRF